ncbi:centromere/kinetochore protein zw10 homolog [Latimeria chalumnae]|uniref:centromere/kinetochore protein zw10 homolog n=1 Tax=Latimeria chalumnae TaxID=7897 RepID=UPI0006D8E17E|nr:PREDICTED: centromere/kinetochore protein zw10 homolog [Latimeria chalumnae]|eukprot:XP_014345598.1 PREDICTED: centromere/kinetochore protein zw10 homolog [Latimeria chalumnae]
MASFVTEVLANSGKLEKEDLGTKISKLSRRVEEIKGEVCDMINKKYNEFLPSMQSAEDLAMQVDHVSSDMDLLKSRIENEVQRDLTVAITEFTELKQQLEKNTVVLSVLRRLQEFDAAIESYNRALLEKDYITAAYTLKKAESILAMLKSREGCELKILKALGTELVIQKQNLLFHLGEEWQKLAVWKLPPAKEPSSLESLLKTELHISCTSREEGSSSGPFLAFILQAFAVLGELHSKLRFFSQLLLKYILKPLITYPSLHACIERQAQCCMLRFECIETKLEHPSPAEVYFKVLTVLEVLHKDVLNMPLGDSPESEKESKVVLAEVLGDLIWEEMSDCLIKECLVYSIPSNSNRLAQYNEVIQATEKFEEMLKNLRFLKDDATDLLRYARNVNAHFASKKCQDVIVAARNFMTSEIHNTIKISPDSKITLPKLPSPESGDTLRMQKVTKSLHNEMVNLENEKQLSCYSFSVPTCRISESVQKLLDLAYQTLLEATSSSSPCAVQLFYTVRNIFQLFYDVVPTYHKENLQKFPQLAAIHHNNCMYIAHHLLTLGHQFRNSLPSPLKEGFATFVDLVPCFRRLGTDCFLAQMRAQKAELLERLSTARNFSNLDDEDNYSAANKAVRQVIHQLKRLGKVWQDVLPVNIYCKAMGTLLNTAITEIISKITALEDISTEDGDRLYSLCRTVVKEGPHVFTPLLEENKNKKYQEEVPISVQKWMKFKELMILLQASLQEIVDRWADGKGSLAAEFTSNEVKSLIRALFQNTDRRAAALTKIK